MKRGAIAVKTPSDVLKALAEKHIFYTEKDMDAEQLTMNQYLNKTEENQKEHIEWSMTVSIKR